MANEEQVRILRQGFEVWNKWRKENPDIRPDLIGAKLSRATLIRANLSGADLVGADLSVAYLMKADLSGVYLMKADLSGAMLTDADLTDANLSSAKLQKSSLVGANLSDANLSSAKLQGAVLVEAKLQGAVFAGAVVDSETLLDKCKVDKDTNFMLVDLSNMRINSGIRQLLEYNIRRKLWDKWFGKGWLGKRIIKNLLVRPFWWMSDYGLSTKRIIASFFMISLSFAVVYATLLYFYPPGIIHDLAVESHEPLWHYRLLLIVRPVYFSVVTMTTLGFGDIYAEKQSILGHILLTIQVLLGYVMLGALVTRFAVLFTAGGPAGKFVPMSKEEKRKLKDIREKQRQEGAEENKQDDEIIEGV